VVREHPDGLLLTVGVVPPEVSVNLVVGVVGAFFGVGVISAVIGPAGGGINQRAGV
jgi:hypothetical protein